MVLIHSYMHVKHHLTLDWYIFVHLRRNFKMLFNLSFCLGKEKQFLNSFSKNYFRLLSNTLQINTIGQFIQSLSGFTNDLFSNFPCTLSCIWCILKTLPVDHYLISQNKTNCLSLLLNTSNSWHHEFVGPICMHIIILDS